MEIYFNNNREKIIEDINKAVFNIYAAIAWIDEQYIIE